MNSLSEISRIPTSSSKLVLRIPAQIHVVRKDGFQAKIYGRANGPWTITWHEPARVGRQRTMRAQLEEARAFAKDKLAEIAKGESWRSSISESACATYQRCKELAQQLSGVPLEVLVSEAVEARQKDSRAKFVDKVCPQIVAELIEVKRREKKCGEKHLRNLSAMLQRLAAFVPGPLHLVQPHDLNQWLRGLKGGLVYRHHHYAVAVQLFNFAKTINAVPRESFGPDFWKLVDDPDRPPVKVKVWSPDYLERLLKHTRASMIPFTVCTAFAGIRHEELRSTDPRKVPLDWSDIDWDLKEITINYATGKTGERIVPMSDNLLAWLKPLRKDSGPLCELLRPDSELGRAKLRAGLPCGKGDSRNVLRKSFGSYRLGLVKNIGQVAEEMGNSPAKIKSNYRKPKSEAESKRWFNIVPTSAGIAQGELKLTGSAS